MFCCDSLQGSFSGRLGLDSLRCQQCPGPVRALFWTAHFSVYPFLILDPLHVAQKPAGKKIHPNGLRCLGNCRKTNEIAIKNAKLDTKTVSISPNLAKEPKTLPSMECWNTFTASLESVSEYGKHGKARDQTLRCQD